MDLSKEINSSEEDHNETFNTSNATAASTADAKETAQEFDNYIATGRGKRLDYLLKQTEIFAHFITNGTKRQTERNIKGKKKKAGGQENDSNVVNLKMHIEENNNNVEPANTQKEDIFKFEQTPAYIKNGALRDYQVQGVNWLILLYENAINGILADEMGLGKTLQTIAFLGYLKHIKKQKGHHLIVVPKSTLQNWCNEVQKWCPSLRTICLIGNKQERTLLINNFLLPGKWDICVTSYEMCLIEKSALYKISWSYMIVDEGHRIKNDKSKLAITLREIKCKNRLLITGTPLQNNLHELWALLNFLLPDTFNSAEDFDEWFNVNSCFGNNELVKRLHSILQPFLLRRLKAEVEQSLLPKKEINIYVGLSEMQREWYKQILTKNISATNGNGTKYKLHNILMQLRKCTNHPYLFDGAEPGPPYTTERHIIDNCGKMLVLDKMLAKLKAQGARVLLFSQFKAMLNILEDYCIWRKYSYCRLDGSTKHEQRDEIIQAYNKENSKIFLFLISTRAGGLGINLATADTVILYDSDWNPQMDLQAMDRAHRIGQKKQVRVFRLITENTIEEKMIERAEMKLRLDKLVIQKKSFETKDSLINIVRFGANEIFSSTKSKSLDMDIDAIMARGETKTMEQKSRLDQLSESALQALLMDAPPTEIRPTHLYLFEGENYREKRKREDEIEILTTKRVRKEITNLRF